MTDPKTQTLNILANAPDALLAQLERRQQASDERATGEAALEQRKSALLLLLGDELATSGAKTNAEQRSAMLAQRVATDDICQKLDAGIERARRIVSDADIQIQYHTARLNAARAAARLISMEA